MHTTRAAAAVAVLAAAFACAVPQRIGSPPTARGIPGFDTRDYPGDGVMRDWFGESPYRWVGYYLPAPCYKGTTWSGRRPALRAMGWGFAVIFVGEQDWSAMGREQPDVAVADPQCSSSHLTAAHARADADDAVAAAAADGFPSIPTSPSRSPQSPTTGTTIFLDVERVERVSPELASYVRTWTRRMLEVARFEPGIYVHDINVEALYPVLAEEFVRAGRAGRPALWVARTRDFDLLSAPRESGYAAATVWQGELDTREAWAGEALNIDVNVADSSDPSGGR